jgi:hypothetical protein
MIEKKKFFFILVLKIQDLKYFGKIQFKVIYY